MSTDTPTTPADMRREAAILRWAAERICRHHGDQHGVAISEHVDHWADELERANGHQTPDQAEHAGLAESADGPSNAGPAEALDDAALAAIEARAEAATEGPWRSEWDVGEKFADVLGGGPMGSMYECQVAACSPMGRPITKPIADAEFIAHARSDVPLLAAEVRRRRGELDDRDTTISTLRGDLDHQTRAAFDNRAEANRLRARVADLDDVRATLAMRTSQLSRAETERDEAQAEAARTTELYFADCAKLKRDRAVAVDRVAELEQACHRLFHAAAAVSRINGGSDDEWRALHTAVDDADRLLLSATPPAGTEAQ